MLILFAVGYGIIQGLCEFLPISSSAHLSLCSAWFSWQMPTKEPIAFDLFLHLGTLLAALIFCRTEVWQVLVGAKSLALRVVSSKRRREALDERERLALLLALASLPMAGAVFLKDFVSSVATSPHLIGGFLLINSLILALADRKSEREDLSDRIGWKQSLAVGIGQLIAVFPGLSRSGTTTAVGMLFGMERERAIRFSFLLSIPTILCANLLTLPDAFDAGMERSDFAVMVFGAMTALLSGLLAMRLISKLAINKRFTPFVIYTALLGLLAAGVG